MILTKNMGCGIEHGNQIKYAGLEQFIGINSRRELKQFKFKTRTEVLQISGQCSKCWINMKYYKILPDCKLVCINSITIAFLFIQTVQPINCTIFACFIEDKKPISFLISLFFSFSEINFWISFFGLRVLIATFF